MRPIYETSNDLANEKDISKQIESRCRMSLHKLSMKYFVDFMGVRNGKVVAVIEVKRRNNEYKRYPTLILSLAKFNHGAEFYMVNGLKFIFAVQFDDGCYFYEYQNGDKFPVEFGGRTDRGDVEDMEPVVHIPIERMERL